MTTNRILFVSSATSYRNHAFINAAEQLHIPWMLLCDHIPARIPAQLRCVVDFTLPEVLDKRVREMHQAEPFSAVLALDDSGAHIATQIAELLALPHNSATATHAARNKYAMRCALHHADIPLPWFACFHVDVPIAELLALIPFPCVIKPLELNGSRGVIRANTPQEFMVAHARVCRLLNEIYADSSHHRFLVESFIPGVEVALEAILDDGVLTPLALFDKPDPLDGPFFEETMYVTPSRLPAATQAEILQVTRMAARAIGLHMGPLHAELRINDTGVYVVEVAGRTIGGLCSQTLQFGSDESLEMLIVRQATGQLLARPQRNAQAGGVMMIPIPHSGILQRIDGVDDVRRVPGIESIEITAPLYHPIRTLPEGESYLGFIFARADTPAAVEAALRVAHAQLTIQITPDIPLMQ
ncbi:MAG: ATP-grasp domain-containing protein [Roseiflexaceae bacterium]